MLVKTFVFDEKYSVLNRDNLTILIQMQLSQKENNFSEFFAGILKAAITFRYFEKKMTLIDFDFPKLRTPETWSDKCLKSPVSDIPSTSNMVNVTKQVEIDNTAPLSYSLITARLIELEKASLIDMRKVSTAC